MASCECCKKVYDSCEQGKIRQGMLFCSTICADATCPWIKSNNPAFTIDQIETAFWDRYNRRPNRSLGALDKSMSKIVNKIRIKQYLFSLLIPIVLIIFLTKISF